MNIFPAPGSKPGKLYTAILLLSLTAVIVTILLIQIHYQNDSVGSFCHIDDYWNCDRVNKSLFAEILGIPISIFGFLYYIVLTFLVSLLMKGYSFQRKLAPFTPAFLLKFGSIIGALSIVGVSYFELDSIYSTAVNAATPALLAWIAAKTLLFVAAFPAIWWYCRKSASQIVHFNGLLALFALFGVFFSLYLTDIELFVLGAICIYCMIQQVLIIIITGLTVLALRQNKNVHHKL